MTRRFSFIFFSSYFFSDTKGRREVSVLYKMIFEMNLSNISKKALFHEMYLLPVIALGIQLIHIVLIKIALNFHHLHFLVFMWSWKWFSSMRLTILNENSFVELCTVLETALFFPHYFLNYEEISFKLFWEPTRYFNYCYLSTDVQFNCWRKKKGRERVYPIFNSSDIYPKNFNRTIDMYRCQWI